MPRAKATLIERIGGTRGLPARTVRALLRERMKRACESAVPIAIGCACMAAVMMTMVASEPLAPASLAWFATTLALCAWLGFGARAITRGSRWRHLLVRLGIPHAILQGLVWGAAPMLLVAPGAPTVATAALGAGGVLLVGSLLLMTIPVFSVTFMLSGAAAFLVSAWRLQPLDQVMSQATMIAIFGAALPVFILHHARSMSRRQIESFATRERHETALLLLASQEAQGRDLLWECDAEERMVRPSRKLCHLAGRPHDRGDGAPVLAFLADAGVGGKGLELVGAALAARAPFEDVQVEVRNPDEPDRVGWWSISGRPHANADGSHAGFVGIGRDFTAERQAHLDLARQSQTDALTGLANRRCFNAFLARTVERGAARAEGDGGRFAVMMLDLERFRSINETFGHATGDALLAAAAGRIVESLRERRPGDHCIARLAGDEFALVLDGTGKAGAAGLANAITQALGRPFDIEGRIVRTAGRIGIALAPSPVDERGQLSRQDHEKGALLQRAELALSQVKRQGRGSSSFFDVDMDVDQRARLELERDLTEDLQEEGAPRFELLYQPLVDPADGRPRSMEALIRWNHARLGTISPAVFIPMAERLGLIERIGRWSLMTACRNAARWGGIEAPRVAVNVSAAHFAGGHLLHHVREALDASGLAVGRLEIEVTESVLVDNVVEAERTLDELHALGVHVALDDFGTGYSSLGYLQRFAFDKLKIDRRFVVTGEKDERSKRILAMIVELGRSLDMTVVAEGIETHAQARMTAGLGCDLLQGYLFSRPIPRAEAEALVQASLAGLPAKAPPADAPRKAATAA